MKAYKYLSLLILPILVIIGYCKGGWWILLTPACCFIIHPLLSIIRKTGKKAELPKHTEVNHFQSRLVSLSMVPVLLFLFAWSLTRLSLLHTYQIIGLAISLGTVNGVIGFTLAHEFIHRRELPEKISGILLLLINGYLHLSVEHIGGHHLYACTNKDPQTARRGESFYKFLPRSIVGTYFNAWEIEIKRLKRKGNLFFSFKNKMYVFSCLHLLCWTMLFVFLGSPGCLFYFVQSCVAIFLLHMISYLQHYGLARKEIATGKFEKISVHHAWNSGHSQQEFNLFQIEKHAEHHMHPDHAYDKLVQHEESPELPGGYTTMICLALIPPLWFRIINKHLPFTS